ncbi:PIG-L family deacetylase [Ideonella sp. BN130291]|uniref:PIG-L family deacetylase n=1 Tax=Ideonella sp. BN130291 TaxID=3112940 RepID=UPI002E25AE74|nr:PIG-L family deacetylase [Ideonella sp. BN130291]
MPTLRTLGRVALISPHLDDAVFSCGQLLAAHPDSTVVTVFAGEPPADTPLTEWDERCGFTSAAQAVALRREEDRIGLSLLEARPVWLDFADSQYGSSPRPQEVGAALQQVLLELAPDSVVFPLGLFHSDHALVHEAVVHIVPTLPDMRWLVYEDALYRGLRGLVQLRLMALAQAGVCATPLRLADEGSALLKARAVQAYASQLRGFGEGGYDDLAAPERCWLYEPAGQG